jgi:hypothetical protein
MVVYMKKFKGNKPMGPILTGYMDNLVGHSQWPGVLSYWTVATSDALIFSLVTGLSFDPSSYNKSVKVGSDTWRTRAKIALVTYEKLLAQLTDPNGIAISFKTDLILDPVMVPAEQIRNLTSPASTLIGWLGRSYRFLVECAKGNALFPEPLKSLTLAAQVLKTQVNAKQIFVLDFEFIITRTLGIAQGDFAAMQAVRQIYPDRRTGEDRLKAGAGGSAISVLGIRLGDNTDNAISFSINEYENY